MSLVRALRPTHEVGLILRVLGISRSTYYHWQAREHDPSAREVDDRALTAHIQRIWEDSDRTYGADRVWGRLRRDGVRVGRKRVERLMRVQGWQGAYRRARTGTAWHDRRAVEAEDLVRRDFTATAPDRLWLADASWIPTRDGGAWIAAIKDVFAGTIVGWSTARTCDTDLIETALDYALVTRDHRPHITVHHSGLDDPPDAGRDRPAGGMPAHR
ncbi:IS3 family transposase [Glycomyces sp. L485]|nr:IS3 family transposase [Glycomyces sp. L485]